MKKIILFVLFILLIPIVSAPVWYGTSTQETNLVLHIPCEGDFTDKSGLGNNGTQSGGVQITRGVKGRACEFDGNYLNLSASNNPSLNISNDITICVWMYPSTTDGGVVVSSWSSITPKTIIEIFKLNTGVQFQAKTSTWNVSTYTFDHNNKWSHVCGVINSSAHQQVLYVNGISRDSDAPDFDFTNIDGWRLGARQSGNSPFYGSLDELRIYNTSLSASEIYSLYNSSKSYHLKLKTTPQVETTFDSDAPYLDDERDLIAHWKLEDTTDSAGSNDGTEVGVTATTDSRWGAGAYDFVGSGSSYINLTSRISNFASLSAGTISAWVKTDQIGGSDYQAIVSISDKGDASSEVVMWLNIDNKPGILIRENGVQLGNALTSAADAVSTGVWYHIAATSDGTNAPIIYINGVDKTAASTGHGFYANVTNLDFMAIGTNHDSSGIQWQFNGVIDEVRFYNKSLSASEINDLYMKDVLVGHWTFDSKDNSTSSLAPDKSGYNNSGTVTGATFTNKGRFKEGYEFDGVNDYIGILNPSSLNLTNDKITISAWIKPTQVYIGGDWKYAKTIFAKTDLAYLQIGESGLLGAYTAGPNPAQWLNGANMTDFINQWSHVAMTYNGTTCKLYLNGVENASDNRTGSFIGGNANGVIGYINYNRHFNGSIDEVKIYSRALSASQIADLYNGSKTHHLQLKSTPTEGLVIDDNAPYLDDESGLVGHWNLDGNALDSSDEGNDGTVTGATITDGRWKDAYEFDGLTDNNDYINISNSNEIDIGEPGTNFTISAWVYADAYLGRYSGIVTKRVDAPTKYWQFATDNSSGAIATYFYGHNGSTAFGQLWYGSPIINEWYMVTVSCERGTANGCKLYENAVLKDQVTMVEDYNMSNPNSMYIGREAANSNTWDGTIDEVRIYNRSLSAAEIEDLYNKDVLVYHGTFDSKDGSDGSFANDTSGYNNDGEVIGSIFTNQGRFKEAYKFDGVNNYINISANAATSLGKNYTDLTVSSWVKFDGIYDGISKRNTIVSDWNTWDVGSQKGFVLSLHYDDSNVSWLVTDGTNYNGPNCDSNIVKNKWYNIIGRFNSSGHASIFVDGIEKCTLATGYSKIISEIATPIYIGWGTINSGRMNGTIDEVKIYSKALSATEIENLYKGEKTNKIRLFQVIG